MFQIFLLLEVGMIWRSADLIVQILQIGENVMVLNYLILTCIQNCSAVIGYTYGGSGA